MICVFVLAFFLPLIWADCPPGTIYEKNFNKCYKFVNQPTGFLAAEQTCQGLGGHLVALENGYETSFVSGVVLGAAPNIKSFWIGANYLITPSWSWTYNVSFSYSNWAPGQPADPSINQCGAVRDFDNFWTKEICNSQKPFVCSIDPNAVPVGSPTCPPTPTCPVCTTPISTTCPPEPTGNLTCPGKCSGNYTQSPIDCKCYHWHAEVQRLSFNDSQTFCESQSGSLIKITSAAQNSWLANWLANQIVGYPPWIGLTCPGPTKDVCYWIDGSPLTGYDNFDLVYPAHQAWNGFDPNLSLVLGRGGDDFGAWLRCHEPCSQYVVCVRDSQ